jgi:lipopolysaccharide/colanic/teichoic acid biosynthesis glycosyltransferase
MTPASARRKRIFDLILATVVVPMVAPVALACACAIQLDSSGPTTFKQIRTGQHGTPFHMYKFRTMVLNAEELKRDLAHLNTLEPPDFKIPNDPRITRVGRFLRATSLDELPQVWNIVRGEMSFVGPRPTSFSPETYELWHTRRLEARPGLTGLWQISGRHETAFDDRSRLDEQYIRNQSIWLDIKILIRTVPALLRREGS